MKVAILGGGGVGCGAAIEIASVVRSVDIFESRDDILLGASRVNEGKIHQGLIYAKDDAELTARKMIHGALDFQGILQRWVETDEVISTSTPFIYALHRDSQIGADQLTSHFATCCNMFNEMMQVSQRSYLGSNERATFWELSPAEVGSILDPSAIETAFQTTEYAVDPRPIADALALAVKSVPSIQIRPQCQVSSVDVDKNGRFTIELSDGRRDGPYDQVVNTSWEGRLQIDASMGLSPPNSYSIRHKYGHRVNLRLLPEDIPSVTTVLGPFGDIVNFKSGGYYLSWYPTGMTSMAANAPIDPSWHRIDRLERLENFRTSSAVWKRVCPRLNALPTPDEAISPTSGMIYALGDTDIDELDSKLHGRSDVGVQTIQGYHTVNTGKYTLFPQMALEVSKRVLGQV